MRVLEFEPVPTLLRRVRSEALALSSFDALRPIRLSRAPGRLDVMGGIADYTGSLVCEMPLGIGTAVALQERDDRNVRVISFNLLDAHEPFVAGISLDRLAIITADELRSDFREPGRKWAAYVLGCLFILHEKGLVDLADPRHRGLNLAVYSTIPIGGGVSSSAALEVATMVNLVDHFGHRDQASGVRSWESDSERPVPTPDSRLLTSNPSDGLALASLCQEVENRIVGAPCGIMDQVSCHLGEAGKLLRLLCQPHKLLPPLDLPAGVKVVGLFTGVRHDVSGDAYARTRAAAFMGHRMILQHMRRLGAEAGKTMTADPTGGYLANLAPDDYKALFRPMLPETITGREFIERYGAHNDPATTTSPEESYPIQRACDHHVLEAQRVRRFVEFIEEAEIGAQSAGSPQPVAASPRDAEASKRTQGLRALRSAGKLMNASHRSYTEKAALGHPAAEVLVDLVRQHQSDGLYGARITGGGCGGTVAVLMDNSPRPNDALSEILRAYEQHGHRPGLLDSSSPGAACTGTILV